MRRHAILVYSGLCYAAFIPSALYFGALLLTGRAGPVLLEPAWAAAVDIGLIAAFAMAHSGMARASFKRVWTRVIPRSAERATYVLQSSLLLALLTWQWQPIAGAAWMLDGLATWTAIALFSAAALLAASSTFLLGHLEFFGLRQAWDEFHLRPARPGVFRTPLLYRLVRHPLQLGLLIMFFATPHMTTDRLLLAVSMACYVAIGLRLEEGDLRRDFGAAYDSYRREVPMILPWKWARPSGPDATHATPGSMQSRGPAAPSRSQSQDRAEPRTLERAALRPPPHGASSPRAGDPDRISGEPRQVGRRCAETAARPQPPCASRVR